MKEQTIKKGLILAGGLGTRFLPWTAGASKTMLPLVDKPTIAHIVDEFILSGITNIMIIVGHSKDNIINYFNYHLPDINKSHNEYCKQHKLNFSPISISFIVQKKLCGTANAVLVAEKFIKADDFVVACGDEIFINTPTAITQMLNLYQKHHCPVIASRLLTKKEATRFGVLITKYITPKLSRLENINEKPPIEKIQSPLVNLGRYILTNNIFDYLHILQPNKNGEFALTDAIAKMAQEEQVLCYNFKGLHYDIGNKTGYSKAFIDFALSHPQTKNDINDYILKKIKTNI